MQMLIENLPDSRKAAGSGYVCCGYEHSFIFNCGSNYGYNYGYNFDSSYGYNCGSNYGSRYSWAPMVDAPAGLALPL